MQRLCNPLKLKPGESAASVLNAMLGKPSPARQVIKDFGARPPPSAQNEAARMTQMAIYGPSKIQRERAKGLMEA
eukprot:8598268-Lingulodinium_polyedra.AAC.1